MSLRVRFQSWRQPKAHPITGDLLQPGERLSWRVMGVYRRWTVFFLIQTFIAAWWIFPGAFHDPSHTILNLFMSDLAVVMEAIMGLAIFPAMLRDSVVMRTERKELHETLLEVRDIHAEILKRLPEQPT